MGTAHLLEHMLLQGIPSLPSTEELTQFVESRAGYINAYTYFETVEFELRLPCKYLQEALNIASEVFFHPLFPEKVLEKERQIMLEEINSNFLSTHDRIGRFFLEAKYSSDSLLKNEVAGMPEHVKTLTMQDLLEFYQELFKTENCYLFIVGNFEEEELNEVVTANFSTVQTTGTFSGPKHFDKGDHNPQYYHFRKDTDLSSVYLDLSFGAMSKDLPVREWLTQLMAMNVLANLHKSRLYNLLRYQKGLIYAISMNSISLPGYGINNIPLECSPEHLEEVLDIIVENLIEMRKNGITQEEFQYIQNYSIDSLLMQFDSMGAIMDNLKQDLLWEGEIFLPERTVEILKEITCDEVNGYLKKYWDFSTANLCLQMSEDLDLERQQHIKQKMSELIQTL